MVARNKFMAYLNGTSGKKSNKKHVLSFYKSPPAYPDFFWGLKYKALFRLSDLHQTYTKRCEQETNINFHANKWHYKLYSQNNSIQND